MASKSSKKSASAPPKGRAPKRSSGRWVVLVLAVLVTLAIWLAFFVLTACYLAPVFGEGWLWVGATALFALGLPGAIAVWMVRPLEGFKRASWFTGAFAALPLLTVLGLSLGAPSHTATALRKHSRLLFERLMGPTTRSAPARLGEKTTLAWARLLRTPPAERKPPPPQRPRARPRKRPLPTRALFFQGHSRPRPRPRPAVTARGPRTQVRFVRRGGALLIRAQVTAKKTARLRLVLDTGATLSALNNEAARKLGITLPAAPVTVELDTAGGRRSFPLAVINRLRVGTVELRHVTVAICDDCSPVGLFGLLGLNFTQHFVTSIDQRRGRLTLQAHRGSRNRIEDIEPFLTLTGVKGQVVGPRVTLTGRIRNRGPRHVRKLRLAVVLLNSAGKEIRRHPMMVKRVPAGGVTPFTVDTAGHADVTRYRLEMTGAHW